jgi:hypothetical protein
MATRHTHIELLPESRTEPRALNLPPYQHLVLRYWREVLERPVDELADQGC